MNKTLAKHTPGPWHVSRSMRGELEPWNAHGIHLLSCEAAKALSLKERQANGSLIAAAPDMYRALQEMLNAHGDCRCASCDAGRAAISKAEEPLQDEG